MIAQGNILKMKGELLEGKVQYSLPIGHDLIPMNQFIGQKLSLRFEGDIHCIKTGKKIKKTYHQGYSYEAFVSLPECDLCMMKPELCHYDQGSCRDERWGEKHCLKPHVVYLSLTSAPKVGITRLAQVPIRWIDQGAYEAIELVRVPNRLESGKVEVFLKNFIGDKTNWRKMLKNEREEFDLQLLRDEMLGHLESTSFDYQEQESPIITIDFPVLKYPEKVKSLSFDKIPLIEGTLMGIKGQYLIFDSGVLNMRKHQGYFVSLSI